MALEDYALIGILGLIVLGSFIATTLTPTVWALV